MAYEIEKVYTDNPYVDCLVVYTKTLAMGSILKLDQNALNHETKESRMNADLYIHSCEGTAKFDYFKSYPDSVLRAAGLGEQLIESIGNKNDIPERYRDAVVKEMQQYYIDNYVEQNDYYRMITGQPPIGYPDIYVTDWDTPDDIVIDLSVPIHKMPKSTIAVLRTAGVLDSLIAEDEENRRFINYIGKDISIYRARKAPRFALLYIPTIDNELVQDMFKDKLETMRLYTLRTVYSEAYKYNSDYYDSFIAAFIVLMTMIDVLTRVQEFIAKKEIFDIRTVQYILKSYGVRYFADIPLKYQVRLVKNLHTLLKHKSTSQCMVDICSLFGFDNITIFKYYLLKDRNINLKTNDYDFNYKEFVDNDGNVVIEEDEQKDFELRFFKLPIQDQVDDYIRNPANYVNYDEITESDKSWDGGLDHEAVKNEILKQEFNYVRTKYISIDTVYDISKISIYQAYFFGMLYDDVKLEELLTVQIPFLNPGENFKLADIFTFLTALSYSYYGIADDIMDTKGKILYVNGFNFQADLGEIAADMMKHGYTLECKEAFDKFNLPTESIPSINQLMEIFTTDLDVREILVNGMYNADNLRVYLCYYKLYKALMERELTLDYYKDPETGDFYRDAEGHATLTEFLKHRNLTLYYIVAETLLGFDDTESKVQYIANVIDNIVYVLEEYIDTEEYDALFMYLPVVSAEAVKTYIAELITFFKSFKVTFLGLNTVYLFDDKYEGVWKVIDDLWLERWWEKPDYVEIYDTISEMKVNMNKTDKVKIADMIYLKRKVFKKIHYNEEFNLRDEIDRVDKYFKNDEIKLDDKMWFDSLKIKPSEFLSFREYMFKGIDLSFRDGIELEEHVYFKITHEADNLGPENEGQIVYGNEYGNTYASGYYIGGETSTKAANVAITEAAVAKELDPTVLTVDDNMMDVLTEADNYSAGDILIAKEDGNATSAINSTVSEFVAEVLVENAVNKAVMSNIVIHEDRTDGADPEGRDNKMASESYLLNLLKWHTTLPDT